MANYHAVLETAIKNNIFNSTSIPYITGVVDNNKFIQANGTKQPDGTYKMKWDAKKMYVGGKDFAISFANSQDTTIGAKTILEILFYLICEASETPEFVMGTAVSSSKASVSEQMPIMLKRAENKRSQMKKYFKVLIETLVDIYTTKEAIDYKDMDYDFSFPNMLNSDKSLNLEIMKALSEEGVISDKTKIILADIKDIVQDPDTEIATARAENKQKAQDLNLADQY